MTNIKHLRRTGLLAALGTSTAILLSGCGGTSLNGTLRAAPTASPVAYGVTPINANSGIGGSVGSGLESADATTGYITGALSSTAATIPGEGPLPLGFPGGAASTATDASGNTVPLAAAPMGASVRFRADLANGNNGESGGAIVPSSVILTSPDVPGFAQQTLTFDAASIFVGPLANSQYVSAPFPLNVSQSGIYRFVVALADQAGQSSNTTFGVAAVAPTDVAVFLQNIDTGTKSKAGKEVFTAFSQGDTLTIDGGPGIGVYPAGYNAATAGGAASPTTADASGTVILFTSPGPHTLTYTSMDGMTTITQKIDLTTNGVDAKKNPIPGAGTTFIQ